MSAESNVGFLVRCVRQFPEPYTFVQRDSGRIYARFVEGRPQWVDADVLANSSIDAEVRAALYAAAPELFSRSVALAARLDQSFLTT